MNRYFSLTAALALAACAANPNIVAGSNAVYDVGEETLAGGTVSTAVGAIQTDFVDVPLVIAPANGAQAAIKTPGVCDQEDAVSVYGSLTGNANVAASGTPSLSLNVGRALATGAAAEYLTLATLATASNGAAPVFAYDCSKTIAGIRAANGTSATAPPAKAATNATPGAAP